VLRQRVPCRLDLLEDLSTGWRHPRSMRELVERIGDQIRLWLR